MATARHHKTEPLIYSYESELKPGAVVLVPFGRSEVLGFVQKNSNKPDFATKPISRPIEGVTLPLRLMELFGWLLAYYPSGSGSLAQLFLPSSLITKNPETLEKSSKTLNTPRSTRTPTILPPLRATQEAALKQISSSKTRHFLLHGETGSGKTRVYIERAKTCLEKGRSALILTPEIGLTPQLYKDFSDQFGEQVVIMHSELTAAKRRACWLKIAFSDKPLVVIGPRSAMFTPLKDIGLVVVDEFHEPAYKQEQMPRYQTVRVAAALAKLHNAEIIYGSATPPVAEYYLAEQTGMPIIKMGSSEAKNSINVVNNVINLADKAEFSRHPQLSNTLLKEVEKALARKEQVLVYLNRRGTARLVICQACGWQALCPKCDIPLTYHGDKHHLVCHTCGYKKEAPFACPVCASTELAYRSIGTKALVETLAKFFPHARLMRFDTDLAVSERMDKHFADVRAGKVDILVGTQMLGKGLDLPHLGLVCIVAADTSLYLPDFTASERSYQLLHQVIGRVGRGHRDGKVIIQTYVPKNPVLNAAAAKDWAKFYKTELEERQKFLFPPFCYLLKITASRKSGQSAEKALDDIVNTLKTHKLKLRLSDPAPSFYGFTHGFHHWQLVIKATDRKELIKALNVLREAPASAGWTYDLDPSNLL